MINFTEIFPQNNLDIPEQTNLSLGFELDININDSIDNTEYNGLPGAYGTYIGNIQLLNKTKIVIHWPEITSVLVTKHFRCCGSATLDTIEEIIKKPSKKGVKHTCLPKQDLNIELKKFKTYNLEEGVYIENTVSGIISTITALKNGTPVIFGVNCFPYLIDGNEDSSTNHYIIIVGMGNDGRNFFSAWDLGAKFPFSHLLNGIVYDGGTFCENKLYIDNKWPGMIKADKSWNNSFSSMRQPYIVTQIIIPEEVKE